MTDDLRRECEQFYDERLTIGGRLVHVRALVAFAKAQRAAEVAALKQRIYSHALFNIEYWLDQRAKEWER